MVENNWTPINHNGQRSKYSNMDPRRDNRIPPTLIPAYLWYPQSVANRQGPNESDHSGFALGVGRDTILNRPAAVEAEPSGLVSGIRELENGIMNFYTTNMNVNPTKKGAVPSEDPIGNLIDRVQHILKEIDIMPYPPWLVVRGLGRSGGSVTSMLSPWVGPQGFGSQSAVSVDYFRVGYGISILRDAEAEARISRVNSTNTRSFKSLRYFTAPLEPGDDEYNLQNIIIGTGVKPVPITPLFQQCQDEGCKEDLERYFANLELDPKEREAFTHAFGSVDLLTAVQCPRNPATSSIQLSSILATGGALLGANVVLCTSTGGSDASEMLRHTVLERQRIQCNKYLIVHFRAWTETRLSLLTHQFVNSVGASCHIWYHILAKFKAEARAGKRSKCSVTTTKAEAEEWLMWWAQIQSGVQLKTPIQKEYCRRAKSACIQALKDITQPVIWLSTCEDTFWLKEWEIKADIVIGVNWSECSYPTALHPLCLGPKKLIVTGFNTNILPHSASKGKNEFYDWLRIPILKQMTIMHKAQTFVVANGKQAAGEDDPSQHAYSSGLGGTWSGLDPDETESEPDEGGIPIISKHGQSSKHIDRNPGKGQVRIKQEPGHDMRNTNRMQSNLGRLTVKEKSSYNPVLDKLARDWGLDMGNE